MEEYGASKVIYMQTYRDYVTWLDPVINKQIKFISIPHNFKIERDPQFGRSLLQYVVAVPPFGTTWNMAWLPPQIAVTEDPAQASGDICLVPYMSFGGADAVFRMLDINPDTAIKQSTTMQNQRVNKYMPIVERVNKRAIADMQKRYAAELHLETANPIILEDITDEELRLVDNGK